MGTLCEVCGDIGFEHLLVRCGDCNGSVTHRYCLDKVLFDASLADCWFCSECQQRHGEVTCGGSKDMPSERQPGYTHFGSLGHQSITKRVGSARDAVTWRNGERISYKKKIKSLKIIYSSENNSPRKKCIKKSSPIRPMGDCTNTKGRHTTSITHTSVKALHSCETIGTETAKSNSAENRQVNNENYVHTWNNVKQPGPVIVNCLGYKLGDIDLLKTRRSRKSKKTSQSVTAPLKGLVVMEKHPILGSKNLEPSSPAPGQGNSVNERSGDRSNYTDNGTDSSFKPKDHDNLKNHPDPAGCKNTKVNSVEDNKTSVGAHQNKYQATAFLTNNKYQVHGSDSNVIDDLAPEGEDEEDRFQQDCRASTELQGIIATNVTQPSTLQNGVVDKVMPYSSNMGILPKESNCLPFEHIEIENKMEYQIEPSKLLDPAKNVLADSATEEEVSDAVQNFGRNNPRKRRKLILLYDDEDDDNKEDEAVDVPPLEDVGPRAHKYDGPMTKHRVDTECYVEAAVLTVDLSNQSPNTCRPVKRQRRYIDVSKDEDEEAILGAVNSDFSPSDVANCARNDGANLTSETVVAMGHRLQSRTLTNSESADLYIYSQPVPEPVWSGFFKVNSEEHVKVDAHLSNTACQEVREVSKVLQPVLELEVKKLPRSQVQPKRWKSSGPTDDCIGLFFFPHSLRSNEVSNGLVTEIIKTDSALKITVGIADLLIFPSTILPEQNHLYQGKHYLWGLFKRRKDMSDKGVVAREQDGAACATEEWKQQKQNLLDEQDGSACASEEGQLREEHLLNQHGLEQHKPSDQETNVVNHVENQQPLVECNSEAQMEDINISVAGGFTLTGCSLSHAEPNSPIESNCSMHPEQRNQQECITSSPEFNASSTAEAKPSTEGDHGQSNSGLEPPTTKLFGILVAHTPRAWQLFQEMASEGAMVFPVQEETAVADYTSTCNSAGVGSGANPDYQHLLELSQPFDFISPGLDEPPQPDAVATDACLELFPVEQEHIGWAPGTETSHMEVDLELSLAAPSRPNPVFQL